MPTRCDHLLAEFRSRSPNYRIFEYNKDIDSYFRALKPFILRTDVVLDIGCGIRPQTFLRPKVHVCVEPFEEYRRVIRPFFPHKCHFVFLKSDALTAMRALDDSSVDTVVMLDLIEHLGKEAGLALLKEADRVARRQILVFTPLGFFPMHFGHDEKDAWGLSGNDVQEHKSGWLPDDFGSEWDFHVCADCHEAFLPKEKRLGKRYSGMMAIKTKHFDGFEIPENIPEFIRHRKRYVLRWRIISVMHTLLPPATFARLRSAWYALRKARR